MLSLIIIHSNYLFHSAPSLHHNLSWTLFLTSNTIIRALNLGAPLLFAPQGKLKAERKRGKGFRSRSCPLFFWTTSKRAKKERGRRVDGQAMKSLLLLLLLARNFRPGDRIIRRGCIWCIFGLKVKWGQWILNGLNEQTKLWKAWAMTTAFLMTIPLL